MRIVSGRFGGRSLVTPHGRRTHPMGERVRGALFNSLGDITGLRVLDAFAGSGAIGLEALSRGAQSVVGVEYDRAAQQSIKRNIVELGLDREYKLVAASVNAWREGQPDDMFDVVIVDPPYDDTQLLTLQKLVGCCCQDGLYVLSWPGGQELPALDGLRLVQQRSYGDARLGFYERTDPAASAATS